MSVQMPKRKPGKLRVETLTFEVCAKTRKLLCNEEIFPKRSRWLGAKIIAEASMYMLAYTFAANDVRVKTPEDARERHRLQTLAVSWQSTLDKLMTFEAFFWEKNPNLYDEWAGLMVELDKTMKGWTYRHDKTYAAWLTPCAGDGKPEP